ncbi:MAG TPA: hypothetical protein VE623_02750 [Acidimicrobiales bacterium]|jgi:hypothetical protein|nr:hypothetical protein [Acidimicrobiales bacterium]
MTATVTPIHQKQTSARTGTLMLFGNPPALTPNHQKQTWARTGTLMLFGNPPSAARQQPRTTFKGDTTT